MFLVYAIIQIDEIRQVFDGTDSDELNQHKIPVTLLTTLIPLMIGLCEIGYLVLSWFCWREMGWDIYKVSPRRGFLTQGKTNSLRSLAFDLYSPWVRTDA